MQHHENINKPLYKIAEAEEAARIQAEAEEAVRIQAEAEEAARIQAEAEEAARIQAEAEEAARIQAEAEEAARIQAEAEEAARIQAEAEEAARIQAEAEEAARIQAEAEEAARIQAEAEEAARIQAEAEEAARIQAEAEEAARIYSVSPVVGWVSSDTDVEGVRGDVSVNAAELKAADSEHCVGYSRVVQRRVGKHRRASFAAHFVEKSFSGRAPRSVAPVAQVVTESNQKGQFLAGFFVAFLAVFAVCGVMLR